MPHKESKDGWLSVTEVLNLAINKPFLAFWRGKIGNEAAGRIQRESQEIGLRVHELIESRFKETEMIGNERETRMVNNFWESFVVPYEVKPIRLETTYESKELKLQGTADGEINTNKGEYVGDWKTSNQLDEIGVPLQLSAYDHLRDGSGKGVAVRIDKVKDKVEVHWYENLKDYWPVYLSCLKVARYVKHGLEDQNGK